MKITLLHGADAAQPPRDPVLDQVAEALRAAGHDPSFVAVGDDIAQAAIDLRHATPDLVFNLAESFRDRSALESSVAGLLNLLGLRYTGSSPAGLTMAGDKSLCTKLLRFHGIRTPEFATLYRGALDWTDDLRFPLIVKPPQEDASIGISTASVVHDVRELLTQLDAVHGTYRSAILVEEFIDGREFYVGVLGNAHAEALPVMELDFTGFPADRPRIASWDAKWGTDGEGAGAEFAGTRSVFPEDLEPGLVERMQRAAVDAFTALRLRDYARVDLRVRADGEIVVIEVNPNCYLEREAEFARAAARGGVSHAALVARIVELASARYAR